MEKIEAVNVEVINEQLCEVEKTCNIAEDSALALRGQFSDYYGQIEYLRTLAATVSEPANPAHQRIAREARLGLRKVRCEVENVRKALKADSLARGKAIDGFANVLKYLCEPVENRLLEVEQYAERQEAARIAALVEERSEALRMVGGDPSAYNLAEMDDKAFYDLAEMVGRMAEERAAEEKRIADEQAARAKAEAEEKERLRAENARLQAEAKAKDAEAARLRAEAAARDREAAEARRKADAEAAKVRAAEAAAAAKEADKKHREKVEAEICEALMAEDVESARALQVAQAIIAGRIPHVVVKW
jgi:hypothetical protein